MKSANHKNLQISFAIHAISAKRQIRRVRLHLCFTHWTVTPAIANHDFAFTAGVMDFPASGASALKPCLDGHQTRLHCAYKVVFMLVIFATVLLRKTPKPNLVVARTPNSPVRRSSQSSTVMSLRKSITAATRASIA